MKVHNQRSELAADLEIDKTLQKALPPLNDSEARQADQHRYRADARGGAAYDMDPADLGVGGIERGVGGSSGGPEPVGVVGYAMRVQRRWAALIATLSSGVLISCVTQHVSQVTFIRSLD